MRAAGALSRVALYAAVFAALVLFVAVREPKPRASHPAPCVTIVMPDTVQCANGHVYKVHKHWWQDLGPITAIPGVPKE